jgi:hypothetical protein
MKIARITAKIVVNAAVMLLIVGFSGALATADQVDDLLAGKPVKIEGVSGESESSPTLSDRIVVPVQEKTLAEESWEVTHAEPSHASLNDVDPSRAARPRGPATTISVVPEPSAIALAALSLVYFLLFFRRRYAF